MFGICIFKGFGESRWMADTCSMCFWPHKVHCLILTFICACNLPKFSWALDVTFSWRLNDLLLLLLCRSWAGGSCTEGRLCQSSPLWACRRLDGGLGLDQIDLWFHWHHKHVLNSLITFSYSYHATGWHLLQATLPVNWRTYEDWCLAGFNETWLSMRNALSFNWLCQIQD